MEAERETMDLEAKDIAAILLKIFEDTLSRFEQNAQMIDYYDAERTDICHIIELHTFNAARGYELAKQLQENRRHRRKHKDENDILEPIYRILKKHAHLVEEIRQAKYKTEHQTTNLRDRVYKPRLDTMRTAFEKAGIRLGPTRR